MRIGILGPISTDSVAELLPDLPPGTPVGTTSAPMLGSLIGALIARGHEVVAFTLVYSQTLAQPVIRVGGGAFTLYICQGRPHSLRPSQGQPGRAVDEFGLERERLLAAMRQETLDVVHAHWFYEYAAAALDQPRVPSVVTGHDDPWRVLRHMPGLYRLRRFLMARRVMREASVLTAVSPSLACRVAGFAGRPVASIPNPLPPALLEGVPSSGGPRHGPRRIGVVLNGWSGLKNGRGALRAFRLLRMRRDDVELEMYGTDFGPGGPAQAWAKQQGCDAGVRFAGELPQQQLLGRMRALDALLHPSLEESFGLVLAEAMALGVPVIAGQHSGAVPWLLQHGRCGLLVDVRDAAAIAEGLDAVLRGGPDIDERVEAARGRAGALCDGLSVAAAYETAYRRAVAAHAGRDAEAAPAVPLRVLHVLNELMPSGAEVMLRTSAGHWPRHGVHCQLLSLGAQPGPYAAPLREAGYALHHLPFEPSLRFVRQFQDLLRAEGIAVVHLHVERASMWLALAVRLAGVRCIVRTVHNNFLFHGGLRLRRVVSRTVMRLVGTRQIAISEMVRETERERFGNASTVIHNWYDSSRIVPATALQRLEARRQLGIADGCFVVLTIGNCSTVKNHAALIEALGRLERSDWCYLHVGCEEGGQPERALATRLGVAERIRFLGLQQDVSAFLRAADLYAMPSLREGLSIASLEAIGAGLPALLGNVPGLRDLQPHFRSVRLSAVDADSLAAALRELMATDAGALRAAAEADAVLARDRFGVERGVAAYVRTYGAARAVHAGDPPAGPGTTQDALPAA